VVKEVRKTKGSRRDYLNRERGVKLLSFNNLAIKNSFFDAFRVAFNRNYLFETFFIRRGDNMMHVRVVSNNVGIHGVIFPIQK
jgi:hypothetical protein